MELLKRKIDKYLKPLSRSNYKTLIINRLACICMLALDYNKKPLTHCESAVFCVTLFLAEPVFRTAVHHTMLKAEAEVVHRLAK